MTMKPYKYQIEFEKWFLAAYDIVWDERNPNHRAARAAYFEGLDRGWNVGTKAFPIKD